MSGTCTNPDRSVYLNPDTILPETSHYCAEAGSYETEGVGTADNFFFFIILFYITINILHYHSELTNCILRADPEPSMP